MFGTIIRNAVQKKREKEMEVESSILDYFKIEEVDGETIIIGDFADRDFSDWLRWIHHNIQKVLETKPLKGIKIENYVSLTFHIGGQRVDIAIVKDGKKGPHYMLEDLKTTLSKTPIMATQYKG